jgi:hypothetical protein
MSSKVFDIQVRAQQIFHNVWIWIDYGLVFVMVGNIGYFLGRILP